jgi:hypothetical protein
MRGAIPPFLMWCFIKQHGQVYTECYTFPRMSRSSCLHACMLSNNAYEIFAGKSHGNRGIYRDITAVTASGVTETDNGSVKCVELRQGRVKCRYSGKATAMNFVFSQQQCVC